MREMREKMALKKKKKKLAGLVRLTECQSLSSRTSKGT